MLKEDWRLPEVKIPLQLPSVKKRVINHPTRYLRTIPVPWLEKAIALPGKALHVGLVIWYYWGLRSEDVSLSQIKLAQFSLNRETARRGLATLEAAGLVTVIRHPGRAPRVRPCELSPETPTSAEQ
jgi:hypothetical protein